jgi:hypothetical protein
LVNPDSRTTEVLTGAGNLQIGAYVPLEVMNRYAGIFPTTGFDSVTLNYANISGQPLSMTFSVTLWMSDAGYVFVCTDNITQLLISGVNGAFFSANAANINQRNFNAFATALQPCGNASRYGACDLLPNQVRPTVWYRDGVLIPQPNIAE